MLPIVAELERNHPIVGWIEDPILKGDVEGWAAIRRKSRIPIIMHGTPQGGMLEYRQDLADIYMIGGTMYETMTTGWALGRANIQVILQHESGTLARRWPCTWPRSCRATRPIRSTSTISTRRDVTTGTIPVVEGSSPVPSGVGLGYEVDESAVERLAAQSPAERPRHVGILHMPGGATWYGRGYVSPPSVTGTEEAGIRGFRSELWEDGRHPGVRGDARPRREGGAGPGLLSCGGRRSAQAEDLPRRLAQQPAAVLVAQEVEVALEQLQGGGRTPCC